TLEADDIQGIESLYPPVSGGGGGGGGGTTLTQPSQLVVTTNAGAPTSSLVLNWLDNSSNETGFRIERSGGGAFAQVATVGANVRTWTDSGLPAHTLYDCTV